MPYVLKVRLLSKRIKDSYFRPKSQINLAFFKGDRTKERVWVDQSAIAFKIQNQEENIFEVSNTAFINMPIGHTKKMELIGFLVCYYVVVSRYIKSYFFPSFIDNITGQAVINFNP